MMQPKLEKASEIRTAIWRFIVDNFLFGSIPDSFSDDDSFLGRGIIDSTGILELIEYIEGTFGIAIEEDELLPENLDSLANAVAFVCRKLGKGS
jgi:acyl carrier protein